MIELRRERTALIVIDMQNAYFTDGSSLAKAGFDLAGCRSAVPGAKRLLAGARAAGIPVVFTMHGYKPDHSDGGFIVHEVLPSLKAVRGSMDTAWENELAPDFQARPGEKVFQKNRFSAFYQPEFEPYLRSHGIDSVVICGVTTNICVESTARDAAQRDFRTFVVVDATGELEAPRHQAALNALSGRFARLLTVTEALQSWRAPLDQVA
ncbi:MAG: cysteine hydrolase [Alphaproteobacteria bacterium]|nr:cysteine hydrolase [Alphaproteobacteria bacterium]